MNVDVAPIVKRYFNVSHSNDLFYETWRSANFDPFSWKRKMDKEDQEYFLNKCGKLLKKLKYI